MSNFSPSARIIFIKNCAKCGLEYDDREDNIGLEKLCLKCNIAQLRVSGCNFNSSLCDQLTCKNCFDRSVASHERARYWHPTKNGNANMRKITLNSRVKYWFICEDCGHDFCITIDLLKRGHYCSYCINLKRCDQPSCKFCFEHSFAGHEKSKYWHPIKNGDVKPRNISPSTNKKYWFYCGECGHDFSISLNHIQRGVWCGYCTNTIRCNEISCKSCFKNSFASNEKSKYWHPTKNGNIWPRDVAISSGEEYWFHCEDCGHDFCNNLAKIERGVWCAYCANKKRCDHASCTFCFANSFANSEKAKYWHPTKNENVKPRDIAAAHSGNKYWFVCEKCNHDFDMVVSSIRRGSWCPYCAHQKRCDELSCEFCFNSSFAGCKRSAFWHPTKNGDVKPRDVAAYSKNKYWFICELCKKDINIQLSDVKAGKWCTCRKYKTEHKFRDFLLANFQESVHQFKPDFCINWETNNRLPFDFCIPSLKIIIEIDGPQHFRDVLCWNSYAEDNRDRDIHKMKMANNNGYSVIRIVQEDVWSDIYDWKRDILSSIEKCRHSLQNIFCSSNNNRELYNLHKIF